MSELQTIEQGGEVADPIVAIIQNACTDPSFDVDKLEKMLEVQERREAKASKERFHHAVSTFQGKCPHIKKSRTIDMGRGSGPSYASYDDVMKVVQPILTECGLSVDFDTDASEPGTIAIVCRVSGFGHTELSRLTLPLPSNMKVNATQQLGAANSYGKRYAIENALNIVVTDQDTDAASLGAGGFITDNQANAIDELLSQLPPDTRTRFWKWLQIGPCEFDKIPASRYAEIVDELKERLRGNK